MTWNPQYRRLNHGEAIQATDQVMYDGPKGQPLWRAPHPSTVGTLAPDPLYTSHRVYRRHVEQDA